MSEKQNVKEASAAHEMKEKSEELKEAKPEERIVAKKQESEYTADEFALNAQKLFGVRPECVKASFKLAGVTSCTKNKAERIVKDFIKKEVK